MIGRRVQVLTAILAAAALQLGGGPGAANAAVVPAIVAVDAGSAHTCALTSGGGVKCWGYGLHGSLGDGTTISKLLPVDVEGLSSGVRAIDAGSFFTCALTTAGAVRCWGWNRSGQLGDGTTTERTTSVAVSGLGSGVAAIATGGAHACALTGAGGVKCWGSNQGGQLGDGTTTPRRTPVDVLGLASGVTAIAAGGGHTCALMDDGGVKCWGFNFDGRLGDGTSTSSGVPVSVLGLTVGVRAISAGQSHVCVLTSRGGVSCWGGNRFGQLGTGTTTSTGFPIGVPGLTGGVSAVSAGLYHSCAIVDRGSVRCWGSNRYSGQLGSGTKTDHSSPVAVVGLAGAGAISVGDMHSCALIGREVACWGDNTYGQLGNGTRVISRVPVDVDFATHQAIVLRASAPAGTIAPGTAVTFSARVTPLAPGSDRATVRFEIYRRDGSVWRLAARRDVIADGNGRANLRWTFVTTGVRSVRAMALADATYAASRWSPRIAYTVG